ncbi:hypothetical protein [Baaleninema simplex]|uniref:hypothetical protein n=1 Tax=Baaleninema simplex TaxID=2862350 RepID=UPI001181C5E0|nr:hypothetical protein [Baaleninema simplex]
MNGHRQRSGFRRIAGAIALCLCCAFTVVWVGWFGRADGYGVTAEPPEKPTKTLEESGQATSERETASLSRGTASFVEGTNQALQAWQLSQSARSPEDWHRVARHWTSAVSAMTEIPLDAPERAFAQKKVSEYLSNTRYALEQAQQSGNRLPYQTFNSPVFDEQFALYRSYVATVGIPDVLVVGSSRALQGLDPKMLQYELSRQLPQSVKVFNFGVNGATAQVVNTLLREFVTRVEKDGTVALPKVVVWADGSRAFNSGRNDRTFARLLASPGYRQLQNPQFSVPQTSISLSIADIDANGFRVVSDRFDPPVYYQQYPRVSGDYDLDYANFNLGGVQGNALASAIQFLQSRQIPLVLVNLPLTRDYLDATRFRYERIFSQFLQDQVAARSGVWVRDLSQQWLDRTDYFADPSHLNRTGAAAVARQLAGDRNLPW